MKAAIDRAHLVGIGGSGMSGLAHVLHGLGVQVSGSDLVESARLQGLREQGIHVQLGHRPLLPDLTDGWLVRSAAIRDDNPEVVEAKKRRIPCLLYAEALGTLSAGMRTVAIAGTHGKTSTTTLTVSAMRAAGLDPSYLIGGDVFDLEGNGHGGGSDLFVVEACEFNRSFHALRPTHAAILNVDADHFDCYGTAAELEESFAAYASNMRHGGVMLVHESVPDSVIEALPGDVRIARVGEGLFADLRAVDIGHDHGRFEFTPSWEGERLPRVKLGLPGSFQVVNALFGLGLAISTGADAAAACSGLSRCRGVARRFQVWRSPQGRELVDDYAHHPAAIRAVLRTVRKVWPGRRILVAFQPHQHLRTLNLLSDFGASLALADRCLIADIYGARETAGEDHGVHAEDVARAVRDAGGEARAAGALPGLGQRILQELGPDSVPVVLGAGELDGVVQEVVRAL